MAKKDLPTSPRSPQNQRRARSSFSQVIVAANRRAHDQVNRRGNNRDRKRIWSVMEAAGMDEIPEVADWSKRMLRWSAALLLLPLCWVTMWTLLSRFSQATVDQEFWKSAEFWYFAIGGLLMLGWFWSGLLQSFFLYLYVLGHELTHAVFVLMHLGKVTDFHVSTEGGYITTNKSNLVIALSPYFVPFWSVMSALAYAALRHFTGLPPEWDRVLYAVLGVTWTFHMIWTLWMIPRDQPDLRENGTFLSLVIIYLANLLVLAGLLCLAARSPWQDSRAFAMEWFRHAATWGDVFVRGANDLFAALRTAAKL